MMPRNERETFAMEYHLANSLASALIGLTPATTSLAHAQTAQPQVPFKVQAFTAGMTDFDVADRLALTNLISADSIQVDTLNLDAWFDLFTADAVFVAKPAARRSSLLVKLPRVHATAFHRIRQVRKRSASSDLHHLVR
jgi:hypothetical protein